MKTLNLTFHNCFQENQVYGSHNGNITSRISFSIDEEQYVCVVRQPYEEASSSKTTPIEVDIPDELLKRINYGEFHDAVETYYRQCVGMNTE